MEKKDRNDQKSEGPAYMVMWHDPQGVPRAWARGPARDLERVRDHAARQLASYRVAKAEVQDPLATALFTQSIHWMEVGDDGDVETTKVAPDGGPLDDDGEDQPPVTDGAVSP